MNENHERRPASSQRKGRWSPAALAVLMAAACGFVPTRAQQPDDNLDGTSTPDGGTEDLARRLIEGKSAESDDVMQRMLNLMEKSERNLKRRFDPGPATQALQDRVILCIDSAIQTALRQRRTATKQAPQRSDRRTMPETRGKKEKSARPTDTGGQAQQSRQGSVTDQTDMQRATSGPLSETRRTWGHLPQRDRDEIIQGSGEPSLQEYRDLIDAYFRALADPQATQP